MFTTWVIMIVEKKEKLTDILRESRPPTGYNTGGGIQPNVKPK